jgi:hypothetical protein
LENSAATIKTNSIGPKFKMSKNSWDQKMIQHISNRQFTTLKKQRHNAYIISFNFPQSMLSIKKCLCTKCLKLAI